MGFRRVTSGIGIGAVEYPLIQRVWDWPKPNIPSMKQKKRYRIRRHKQKITANPITYQCLFARRIIDFHRTNSWPKIYHPDWMPKRLLDSSELVSFDICFDEARISLNCRCSHQLYLKKIIYINFSYEIKG